MRVAIAPDSFKGCLSATEVAEAIATGLRAVWPEIEIACVPMADGGEGTADVWMRARSGEWVSYDCTDGLGRAISARVGWIDDGATAIVEAARAVGLDLLTSAERNPWIVSSFGLGELVRQVLAEPNVKTIWLTLGGSATVDGGLGCLQALGIPIETAEGDPVPRGGRGLSRVTRVDWSKLPDRLRSDRPDAVDLCVACDVTNPLLGNIGAARVFGPQKGADPDMVEQLERGMQNWASQSDRRDVADSPGAGAAGGLGFALGCLGAEFYSGIGRTIETVNLAEHLHWADWVITGEGRCDRQTAAGKVVSGVLAEARKYQRPVVVLAGGVDVSAVDELMTLGATAVMAATPAPGAVEDIIANGAANLQWSARNIAGLIQLGQTLGTTS
ncbi:MAG: glycerate kinase [Cyanobacteria bacterium J06648_11]